MPVKKFLDSFNLFGLDHLDSVILAALSDEKPLLLIGKHGTAKSELLNRLAGTLGLEHRHYNASLLAFDDLLGFPVPNKDRTELTYIKTEDSLWGAESVFLDELSRCRVENQNKLFSIIHEKRVQGKELTGLRYRWAAINPPPSQDGEDEDEVLYTGSLPLDPALADRFPYVIRVPALDELSHEARISLLTRAHPPRGQKTAVKKLIAATGKHRNKLSVDEANWIARYVNELVLPLREAAIPISSRRAVQLTETIASVHAAAKALGHDENLSESAFVALYNGLPHVAHGIRIRYSKLKSIHSAAVKTIGNDQTPRIWRKIRAEKDCVKRIVLALDCPTGVISKKDFSTLVSDAWAGLGIDKQYVLSGLLVERLTETDCVTSATYEVVSEPLGKLAKFSGRDEHSSEFFRNKAQKWDDINAAISQLKRSKHPNAHQLGNIFYVLFLCEKVEFKPSELIDAYDDWARILSPSVQRGAKRRKSVA